MFDSVLIANRGEIALRILRACRQIGLKTVAVHSEADATLRHVKLADQAICIGPAAARDSYLNVPEILLAAKLTGAGAIHPGYGFLSENASFAEAVEDAGIAFIGPTADSIRRMGDKVSAKQAMLEAGVPCVPGSEGALPEDDDEVVRIGKQVGYPLIVKAAGGGGGKGMRVVRRPEDLLASVSLTRQEADRAFKNAAVYMERFLEHPRHIEIQVLADQHGNAVWLGERDCSLQRRHQKVVEEAPAPGISRSDIAAIGQKCVEACLHIGYRGAGTFEFLYENGEFCFIEMNTRVQVEHPVTELICGVDIVAEQLRIAMGLPLSFSQKDVVFKGHAIECRINAEHPWTFMPSPGRLTRWVPPGGGGIRVESHMYADYEIPPHYDSLIAKIISYGEDREQALKRMRQALDEVVIEGIDTNVPLHEKVLKLPDVVEGGFTIHFLEKWLTSLDVARYPQ
ncbi:acetyl-CoA carboxylase biotin carboxylase subunit [Cupriavidus taiwanensis]|uniref:Biotin carboxylase n=1 Tax=Cupriavidus taiwanensis TaxID=164546 RepID=A0A7Z7NRI0_9BURK|nr:acetyl-CoA carboxylase biotin carboxylase subunit [Cupriavidus taiwanensis]SOZ19520.1 acetyl-CoA carboxylase, biotin carboxylase subunit [Cupriavidus taiwanensis]SOZ97292.1 acetyl-CoA carboxylase, biotin carboxylase subunit [Cupriavidus taiwanensis]SPC26181.1 acetyl-CoA carboxylase, biotin carboxylase subunit [Cupriavidus taiwanensis]SPD37687.1 acetyl-CoA carboxylase, biotin carboxylase subunit [Cupriavidus taiwanensis]